jgi:hypothetical protein
LSEGPAAPSTETATDEDPASPAPADGHVDVQLWRALGDDFALMKDAGPPERIAHGRERLLMCRLYVGLIRTLGDDYGAPFTAHSDSATFRAIGIYVFFRTLLCALSKHGYVERVGNAYRATEKVNIPDLGDRLQARIDMIADTARQLAELQASIRDEALAAPEPGEP